MGEFFFFFFFFFPSFFSSFYSSRVSWVAIAVFRTPVVCWPPPPPFFTSPFPIVPAHPFPTHAQVEIVPARSLFAELGSDGYPSCSRDWCSLDRRAHNMGYLGVLETKFNTPFGSALMAVLFFGNGYTKLKPFGGV